MPSDSRLQIGIEPELVHHLEDDALVVPGLLEILLPFFLEVGIDDALECGLINLDAAPFGLQRLIQKLGDLFVLHDPS